MTTMKTVSATVPAGVKAEATAFAKGHGSTVTAMAREIFTRIAVGDKEVLAWIAEEAKRDR